MDKLESRMFWAAVFVIFITVDLHAKEWRGIVPLKSTRADVERLLGKENELKRYQFENERAYIFYSTEGCGMMDATEVTEKCRCLISEGTVVSIHVTLEESRKFSSLKRNKREFQKDFVLPGMYQYSDLIEGVRYTVYEQTDQITDIDYLPSAKDCDDLVKRSKPTPANEWQGLVPLHSSREDVERLLGKPEAVFGSIVLYRQSLYSIWIKYVNQGCVSEFAYNVPLGTVERIVVDPMRTVLPGELKFDLREFQRIVSFHPRNVFYYLNHHEGITVETRLYGDREEVTRIIYEAAPRDEKLRCPSVRNVPPNESEDLQSQCYYDRYLEVRGFGRVDEDCLGECLTTLQRRCSCRLFVEAFL